ncbi:hypothetical protein IQ264_01180 [Phormidium sp. LEGE 05292]|uniref:hypothetical protein n=1 Tax=[Phormidium] sp. LEGE 05292 TaxID=767427 RepID=UPI00187E7B03|nr:hypothetical protein [Phormidium sp. LEGE 05292]MBE9224085.1 hypothetical protein [Phormidium sp. LEGE 05292]
MFKDGQFKPDGTPTTEEETGICWNPNLGACEKGLDEIKSPKIAPPNPEALPQLVVAMPKKKRRCWEIPAVLAAEYIQLDDPQEPPPLEGEPVDGTDGTNGTTQNRLEPISGSSMEAYQINTSASQTSTEPSELENNHPKTAGAINSAPGVASQIPSSDSQKNEGIFPRQTNEV